MNSLELSTKKLDLLLEKKNALLLKIKKNYELEDESYEDSESVENAIFGGDISLEWSEYRDVDYADDVVGCQEKLVRALELLEAGDKKSVHNANKALEILVNHARMVKKDKEDDIRKAQEVISLMNEIIAMCDKHRK